MELDIIEIRAYNYFATGNQGKQILQEHLKYINPLLTQLQAIPITYYRLSRLNFAPGERSTLQKFIAGVYFNFYKQKGDKLLLVIGEDIKLSYIQYIHQLQNVYYDLTGDVLKIPQSNSRVIAP